MAPGSTSRRWCHGNRTRPRRRAVQLCQAVRPSGALSRDFLHFSPKRPASAGASEGTRPRNRLAWLGDPLAAAGPLRLLRIPRTPGQQLVDSQTLLQSVHEAVGAAPLVHEAVGTGLEGV